MFKSSGFLLLLKFALMKYKLLWFSLLLPLSVFSTHIDTLHPPSTFYVRHFIPIKDLNPQAALFCNQLLISIKEGRVEAKKNPFHTGIDYQILEEKGLPQDSVQFVKHKDTTLFKISEFTISIPNPHGDWDDPFDVIDTLIDGYFVDYDALILSHLGWIEKWEYTIGVSPNPQCFSPLNYQRKIVAMGLHFIFDTDYASDVFWVYPPFTCRFPLELDVHRAFLPMGTYQNKYVSLLRLAGQRLFETHTGTLHPLDLQPLSRDSVFRMHTLSFFERNKELSRTSRQASKEDVIGLRLHERIIIENNAPIRCQTLHTSVIAMDEKYSQHYIQKRYRWLPYAVFAPPIPGK